MFPHIDTQRIFGNWWYLGIVPSIARSRTLQVHSNKEHFLSAFITLDLCTRHCLITSVGCNLILDSAKDLTFRGLYILQSKVVDPFQTKG